MAKKGKGQTKDLFNFGLSLQTIAGGMTFLWICDVEWFVTKEYWLLSGLIQYLWPYYV